MATADGRLSLSATREAFNAVLKRKSSEGARGSVWFKESSARNLRNRDFLAPQAALRAMFSDGQVLSDIVESMVSLKCPRVPPIQSCQMVPAGLTVKLARPAVFEQILNAIPMYTTPLQAAQEHCVILNCVPLHGCKDLDSLSLNHLRAILVTDHLAGMLQTQGINVRLAPSLADEEIHQFLRQLRIEWPLVQETSPNLEHLHALKEALRRCPQVESTELPPNGVLCKLHLKKFLEEKQLEDYDPKLDIFLVTEEKLRQVAELQRVALQCLAVAPGRSLSVVHIVDSKEAFQQQKVDLLWRLVVPQASTHLQKHLICGPVKTICSASPMNALQYFQLRHSQMYEASVLKYGDLSQDDTWTETVSVLTSAAIRFEILSTAHQSQKGELGCWGPALVLAAIASPSDETDREEESSSKQERKLTLLWTIVWVFLFLNGILSYLDKYILKSSEQEGRLHLFHSSEASPKTSCRDRQVLLDVHETSVSTKGTKSGAFVMYNCARLATLFETYKKAEEQGVYPAFPPPSELNYFTLREEGEWLLLFNGVLPFHEVLSQAVQLPIASGGIRITANTDAICKFLIQLSMDFSSYYNRVHILGEPRPHLFSQMFARLQLMRAVREVFHRALATLQLPPLSQI